MSDQPNPTVLIVDDEPSLANGHAEQLADYDVRTANSGTEALESVDRDVDVVLLDRRMPGLSGDQVLEHLRDREVDCRIVMLTGVAPSMDIVEMGFDDYLRKPVSGEELRSTVDRMFRRSAYDEKLRQYFSLATRRATLETEFRSEELTGNPRYEELCARLESVQDDLDEVLSDLPERDGYVVATDTPDGSTLDAGTN